MDNFYQFWNHLDQQKALNEADQALEYILESLPAFRQQEEEPHDGDNITGTGKRGEPIYRKIPNRGRTKEVGMGLAKPDLPPSAWKTSGPQLGRYTPSTSNEDWSDYQRPAMPLDRLAMDSDRPDHDELAKIKKELHEVQSLLDNYFKQKTDWEDPKTGEFHKVNQWITVAKDKIFNVDEKEMATLTPELRAAFGVARDEKYITFEDDYGNPVPALKNGVNIVMPDVLPKKIKQGQVKSYTGEKPLNVASPEDIRSANQDTKGTKSPVHIGQQRARRRSLKPKTTINTGRQDQLTKKFNQAAANYRELKQYSVDNPTNTAKAAKKIIDVAREIMRWEGALDPKFVAKITDSDIISKMQKIVDGGA